MKTFSATLALLLGTVSSAFCALDLTPHEVTVGVDGPAAKRYYFEHADQRLSFKIDNKMTVSGSTDELSFAFNDIQTAAVKLAQSPMRPVLPFDEKNLELYRASARSFIPPGAADIHLEDELPNAIAINGWKSHQFVFSYNFSGRSRRRTVTFVTLNPEEQVVLDVGAVATDYDKTYARSYRVLNSIAELPAFVKAGPT
jgi:hypothetical protein